MNISPTFTIAVLLALAFHEAAHAYVAYKLGDSTAKFDGRLTLNPIVHLDLLGTLMFIFIGFGWAKPVPVDLRNLKNPKRDNALIALAGPVSNLVLALIACGIAILLNLEFIIGRLAFHPVPIPDMSAGMELMAQLLRDFININVILMAFNLLPIAPLDGSKVLQPFIPMQHQDAYDDYLRNGMRILVIIILIGIILRISIFWFWINLFRAPIMEGMWALSQLL